MALTVRRIMATFRTRSIELFDAWKYAAVDVAHALEVWRSADRPDKRNAHAAYVAALDREAHAAAMLQHGLAG
jgi:hypothetical protein